MLFKVWSFEETPLFETPLTYLRPEVQGAREGEGETVIFTDSIIITEAPPVQIIDSDWGDHDSRRQHYALVFT